jgi:phage regulator Rha-like protein
MNENKDIMVPDEVIMSRIYLIRGQKVMLDMDLAELYGIETKQLKRAVRRNIARFPPDFMFELSQVELSNWRRQFGTSNREKMGIRIPPFAFTDYGILMLASVLNSERAIQVNIRIVRIFSTMREMFLAHKEITEKLKEIEQKIAGQDDNILVIFEYLHQLEQTRQQQAGRKRIGFRKD